MPFETVVDGTLSDERLTFWAKQMEGSERIVQKDNLTINGQEVLVSTVFLGLDHNYMRSGPPLWFETLVFGGAHDGEMNRYSTWEDAEKGHAKLLGLVKSAIL